MSESTRAPKAQVFDPNSRLRSGRSEQQPRPEGGSDQSAEHDAAPYLNVVLVEPEIPPNTGNIARICAATSCTLHLVHPLGFQVDEKAVRRAGLDYWHLVRVVEHQSFLDFTSSLRKDARCFFFTGKTSRSYLEVSYERGDYLIFGKESSGLDESILRAHQADLVGIPTLGEVRSLNIANCVALGVYEALRAMGALDNARLETVKGPSP